MSNAVDDGSSTRSGGRNHSYGRAGEREESNQGRRKEKAESREEEPGVVRILRSGSAEIAQLMIASDRKLKSGITI